MPMFCSADCWVGESLKGATTAEASLVCIVVGDGEGDGEVYEEEEEEEKVGGREGKTEGKAGKCWGAVREG